MRFAGLAIVVAWLALGALPASAATVKVSETTTGVEGDIVLLANRVDFKAAPGESNTVTITLSDDRRQTTIIDTTAGLEALAPCTLVDPHTARCPTERGLVQVDATLGDGSDILTVAGPPTVGRPPSVQGIFSVLSGGGDGPDSITTPDSNDSLDGGPGDDVLAAGAGTDTVSGGGGRDQLRGDDGQDTLRDGDDPASPDADELDGGAGTDTVDYSARTGALTVDLSDAAGDGELYEMDMLAGFERVDGGSGDDRLTGDALANELRGNAGDDALASGSGADILVGGAGEDTADCGGEADVVDSPDLTTAVDPSCERVLLRKRDRLYRLRSTAKKVTPKRVALAFACPSIVFRDPLHGGLVEQGAACAGTITLREAAGRKRVLGRVRVDRRRPGAFTARVPLSSTGRSVFARGRPVDLVVATAGKQLPRVAWRTRV